MDELKEGGCGICKIHWKRCSCYKALKKNNRLKIRTEKWEMEAPLSDIGLKKERL